MVKTFLRKTIGSVPFVGQCFLLSDYLEWARNSGTSEVLYSIINLFEKKKLLVPDFVPRGFEARQEGFRGRAKWGFAAATPRNPRWDLEGQQEMIKH